MAPTKPNTKPKSKGAKARRDQTTRKTPPTLSPKTYLDQATAHLERGDALSAAGDARRALEILGDDGDRAGAAACLLGEIYVELGEVDKARATFLRAVAADEDGSAPEELGGGADKFLWLAQLSEDGGADSVAWFERGAASLRAQVQMLTEAAAAGRANLTAAQTEAAEQVIEEKKRKLSETLCAVAEVYMTDLSWEADAEQRCEALVTEATLLAPQSADAWQTVASVRVSQSRAEDARAAVRRSMDVWAGLAPEDPAVPAFATRVGLVRLLMEVDMEECAVEVAERLVREDDQAVEVWYLGGYGLFLLGEKARNGGGEKTEGEDGEDEAWKQLWASSRRWLAQCLSLFQAQQYEDERLGEHATELFGEINKELGEVSVDGEEDEGWEETDGGEGDEDEDEEMQ